jgi:ABC-type dipeptide/oligopeptide/nickel transport system permease component
VTHFSRSLLTAVPTMLGVLTFVFLITRLIPGDPVAQIMGPNSSATAADLDAMRAQLGLDQPLHVQYFNYMTQVLRGDLGVSLRSGQPIFDEIVHRFPYTFELVISAQILAVLIGVPLGVLAALRRNTIVDTFSMGIALIGTCAPVFWLGIIFILIFGVQLRWFPVLGADSSGTFLGRVYHMVLPAMTLGLVMTSIIARITRSAMIDALGEDYIRTAMAKGLSSRAVAFGHGLRNALLPVITVIGTEMGRLLGGTVVLETVFSRPGLGKLITDAMLARDYPVVQGGIAFFALVVIFVNITIDMAYAYVDPRIRYR